MKDFNRLPQEAIYIREYKRVVELMKILSDEGYAVLLTREEGAYMINYISTYDYNEANRNQIVFMDTNDFYELKFDKN